MRQNIVDVEIPETLVPYLYMMKDGKTMDDKVTISIVVGLFASGTITLEKAAELAGKSIRDFIDFLKAHDIPWGSYTEEEFKMDELAINHLLGGMDDSSENNM